jgi:6-pyruvoyltetrahydropterin/6-carboxytetrahydropterin synthase
MFELQIISRFAAAHCLRNFNGRCEALHGHNWRVEVAVRGRELDEADILFDFGKLKALTRQALDELDHTHLNELAPFSVKNPSSEMIARYIFQQIKPQLPGHVRLTRVSVWESEDSRASYFE